MRHNCTKAQMKPIKHIPLKTIANDFKSVHRCILIPALSGKNAVQLLHKAKNRAAGAQIRSIAWFANPFAAGRCWLWPP